MDDTDVGCRKDAQNLQLCRQKCNNVIWVDWWTYTDRYGYRAFSFLNVYGFILWHWHQYKCYLKEIAKRPNTAKHSVDLQTVNLQLRRLMVVGIDCYHDLTSGRRSVGALVANLNQGMSRYLTLWGVSGLSLPKSCTILI